MMPEPEKLRPEALRADEPETVAISGLWLRRERDHVVVLVEHDRRWFEVIRGPLNAVFSHIAEPAGIKRRITS